MMRVNFMSGVLASALVAGACSPSLAQNFGLKTINLVVGASPGGGYDAYTRLGRFR